MKLAKSLLLGTAAGFAAVAGAQAADLPSRKAAPVNYVKICDAYGEGYFFIPGTDTCLRVGGYVRVEFQYTPGRNVFAVSQAGTNLNVGLVQVGGAQDTTGSEVRGRVDLDARTPTALGTVRTMIQLRAANTSGIRNTGTANNAAIPMATASATGITIERAFVQWAGFTFGVAPENYAMMPSQFYNGNPWAGFPNGMKQLAYTATFGGGFSATLALEDRTDFGYTPQTYRHSPLTGYHLVGNIRVDQSWGFAALHGMIGNNSIRQGYATSGVAGLPGPVAGVGANVGNTALLGGDNKSGFSVGATVKFNLPMLAAGDAIWITANYADGLLGGLMSNGSMNSLSNASGRRVAGGIISVPSPLVVTSGNGTIANPYTVASTKGWNLAAAMTHYWSPQWRSNFSAGIVQINPPSVSGAITTASPFQWGKITTWELRAGLVYSPAKDFDIGLEVQYLNVSQNIQNRGLATNLGNCNAAACTGLKDSSFSTHMRVERRF